MVSTEVEGLTSSLFRSRDVHLEQIVDRRLHDLYCHCDSRVQQCRLGILSLTKIFSCYSPAAQHSFSSRSAPKSKVRFAGMVHYSFVGFRKHNLNV